MMLPAVRRAQAIACNREATRMSSPKTVLIVDDDRDARFVFSAILNFDGYHAIEALDGARGVAMAREHHPDLVIMDVNMPYVNGIEAVRLLHEDEATRDIPVILITAGDLASVTEAKEAGVSGVLPKPIEPRRLMEEAARIIGPP